MILKALMKVFSYDRVQIEKKYVAVKMYKTA